MDRVTFSSDTSRYIWVQERLTYDEAVAFAEREGGTLAAINSRAENDLIFRQLRQDFNPQTSPGELGTAADGGGAVFVWLGGNDRANEGEFVWETGEAFNFTRFGSGALGSEPDNFNGNQDALTIGLQNWPVNSPDGQGFGNAGFWNDINEDNELTFLIEIARPTDGNDVLNGSEGADNINGLAGRDTIDGNLGNDTLIGAQGSDVLNGGGGQDSLLGGIAADRLTGGGGSDVLSGGQGRDTLIGGGGSDRLLGGRGSDELSGGAGRDDLVGGTGTDRLMGGGGRDMLDGRGQNDVLLGGGGADTLLGGAGRDNLTGGRGSDVFVFGRGDGPDRIRDFSISEDVINLSGFDDLDDFQNDILPLAQQQGSDIVIDFGDGDVLTINDEFLVELTASDFSFEDLSV